MSENPKDERPCEPVAAKTEYEEGAAFAAAQAEAGDNGQPSPEDVIVELAAQNEELKERALRLAAEMENLRRRTTRDVHDARAYAIANFARDMLSVSDNLERALDAIPAEARESGDAGFKALVEGVEMTGRAMLAALERHGVKTIEPGGEAFDPHYHQAMFEVQDPSVPANTVVQVMQTGYLLGDRVLRPAMVGVAKGGPKQAPAPAASDDGAKPAQGAARDA